MAEFDGPVAPPAPKPHEVPTIGNVREIFSYDVPPGWVENLNPAGQRILEFVTGKEDREAEVTFTIFPGTMGGIPANLNRWRRQVSLGPIQDNAAMAEAKPFSFVDRDGFVAEARGADQAILCVFNLHDQFSMFLKMSGLPAAVEANREHFLSLARSLKTKGHQ